MDKEFKKQFIEKWDKYFPQAELPITFYYTDEVSGAELEDTHYKNHCLIANLKRVRNGHTLVYHAETEACAGGKRFTGFVQELRPNFEYFLSCGTDEMEGERYKKTPELVKTHLENHPLFSAPGRYLVFKRWDKLKENDNPLAVIFFARPDALAGLFTLANFDYAGPDGVIAPMGAGCASIVEYALEEANSEHPRCVLGMFDVSARPFVPRNMLTFTIPTARFATMVDNMDESFLITGSWKTVTKRMKKA